MPTAVLAGTEEAVFRARPLLDERTVQRLADSYGMNTLVILDHGRQLPGKHFGHGLCEPEIR